MGNLVVFEISKLVRERQFHFAVALIVLDLGYVYFFANHSLGVPEVSTSAFANWLNAGTSDTAFMLFFIGLSSTSIFATEYSYSTYKNYLPYTGKVKAYIAKALVNIFALLALLLFWYFVAACLAAIQSGSFEHGALALLFQKLPTQLSHLIFNGGILAVIISVVRHLGIANAALVLSWFSYGFIPVAGIPFYAHVSRSIAWGAMPNVTLVLFFVLAFVALYFIAGVIFSIREVRT